MDPPPAIRTPAQLFEKHDLEFRTITSLLHKLNLHDKITLDSFRVSQKQRPYLKLLAALSSLLVCEHEVLAIMPKRSAHGTTLFVVSGADEQCRRYICDDGSATSGASTWPSSSSHENIIPRNPRLDDPVHPVELLVSRSVHIQSDVLGFILRNWRLSFESHVQAFASLLDKSLYDPQDDQARLMLEIYSLFQSSPKIHRRLKDSARLRELQSIQSVVDVALVPSSADKFRIRGILTTNENGARIHRVLYAFLRHKPLDPQYWLPEFHRFFLWLLHIVDTQLILLNTLRTNPDVPPELPESMVNLAFSNLNIMRFFAWESEFFESYIRVAFGAGVGGALGVAASVAVPSDEVPGAAFQDENEEEDEYGLDISTEFDTGEETTSAAETPPEIHPCIAELRLITSNIQNIMTLLRRAPKSRFRFEVIQYAPAGKLLKPWRVLIEELLPNKVVQAKVLKALRDTPGKQFNVFREDRPELVFKGHVHCEALLGCLYSLTKRGEDISWTGIPKSVLDAIRTCYSVLAPSKRCCPVCATTISLLSQESAEAGGSGINALSKHSVIFPCAFPVGLPCSIREKLLRRYREELRKRLITMLELESKLSGSSQQNDILSLDGKPEDTAEEGQWALLSMLKTGWAALSLDQRRGRWGEARENLAHAHLLAWWAEMGEDTKVGLAPPPGEEAEETEKSTMTEGIVSPAK